MFRWLFHILFWLTWIFYPLISRGDNEEFQQFYIAILPVVLSNIPLFLLNSNWLIPYVFRKRGIGIYLLGLLVLVLSFSVLQYYGKRWLAFDHMQRFHNDFAWTVIILTFLSAISTGYGFIIYLLEQEKTQQEERQERLQSEVSFLRSQISPHFIFNILNSIVYLIRSRSEQAEAVTLQLSELMRYMLYDSRHGQVPLDMELNYLKNYIDLQKMRFEEDVVISQVTEGTPGAQTIEPMLLIPFVENAFKHGIGLIADPTIAIFIRIEAHQLDFKVVNKIAPETATTKDGSSGIGLRNVRRRLDLLYPGKYHLDIKDDDGNFVANLSLELR
ncbi:MAG: histidine kinase [Lewinellaceae bacterium]|nr:histidine kinase [Lewinellaceae bacterium]